MAIRLWLQEENLPLPPGGHLPLPLTLALTSTWGWATRAWAWPCCWLAVDSAGCMTHPLP